MRVSEVQVANVNIEKESAVFVYEKITLGHVRWQIKIQLSFVL